MLTTQAFLFFIFIFLTALFSCIETAFISLSDIKIQHLMDNKIKGIQLVKALKDNSDRLIITILIGTDLVQIAASSLATSIAIDIFESHAIGIAVGVMTVIMLIFGEIIPKSIGMSQNEWITINTAPIIKVLQYILFPVIKLLEWFMILTSTTTRYDDIDPIITEAEIKSVVNLGEKIGEVEEDERIMIHNIFRFTDLKASDIMVDRMKMFSVNGKESLKNTAPEMIRQGYSRIPVYEGHPDNIIGILYVKDIIPIIFSCNYDIPIRDIVRPPMFITESMPIDDLLKEFQKKKIHIALIVDEHGGIAGLVTIEDLLEEIVGDIYDETDGEPVTIKKLSETKSLVRGDTEIEEVNRELNLNLSENEDYYTISGFILHELQRIPKVGVELKIKEDYIIRITKADRKRIIEVEIEKIIPTPPEEK
ncbi:MAG: HlyC/CorC family transporter [Desulfobacterales bacterium]|nr:HlyC/CorC family transporter [Desulfobacterales bacterium]